MIVEGPTADLQFSQTERTKVVTEVQHGLSWLGGVEPKASVTWSYDIKTVRVDVPPDPSRVGYEPLESLWRDPAMAKIGFAPSLRGVRDYVASIRVPFVSWLFPAGVSMRSVATDRQEFT